MRTTIYVFFNKKWENISLKHHQILPLSVLLWTYNTLQFGIVYWGNNIIDMSNMDRTEEIVKINRNTQARNNNLQECNMYKYNVV